MASITQVLASPPPSTVSEALQQWPERSTYTPSPQDWRDEFFYFLLPDRFSDGGEAARPLLTHDLSTGPGIQAIQHLRGPAWNWQAWQESGKNRFQGGTIAGIHSKLGYLKSLGVTTLWIAPLFRQRADGDTYHGYGIQHFFDIDPSFGTRKDLVDLVDAAHLHGMRIILDVIINHSGSNWLYDPRTGDAEKPPYLPQSSYTFMHPRSGTTGAAVPPGQPLTGHDFVLPKDLWGESSYVRAGKGSLGAGDIEDPQAEHKRTDFEDLRKFQLDHQDTFTSLLVAFHYWIALCDVDGFRIDTVKHLTFDQARNFCNGIKEYAETLGKDRFFLVAEVAGGDPIQERFLKTTGRNLDACLDIGEQRLALWDVVKGGRNASDYFAGYDRSGKGMGSHRTWGSQHLSVLDDHDHVFGSHKLRFACDAPNRQAALPGIALQLLGLGIPCLYYGTEQGLASGAEPSERQWVPEWSTHDVLLREAMFGPDHPRKQGTGRTPGASGMDASKPGFGPHGTVGHHVFNPQHPLYVKTALLAEVRRRFHPLRRGRQYQREISFLTLPFGLHGPGQLIAWSRIFDDQEVLVVVNPHGYDVRSGRVATDPRLSVGGMRVVQSTGAGSPFTHGVRLAPITAFGWTYVDLTALGGIAPGDVVVLANNAAWEAARP